MSGFPLSRKLCISCTSTRPAYAKEQLPVFTEQLSLVEYARNAEIIQLEIYYSFILSQGQGCPQRQAILGFRGRHGSIFIYYP